MDWYEVKDPIRELNCNSTKLNNTVSIKRLPLFQQAKIYKMSLVQGCGDYMLISLGVLWNFSINNIIEESLSYLK